MHRYLIVGTDHDVGKTRVVAALALALKEHGLNPTIVKLVQTGMAPGIPGDAARAGRLAGVRHLELGRFQKADSPWAGAVAQGAQEIHAYELVDTLKSIDGPLVAEGSGVIADPLNRTEHFGHVAVGAKLEVVLVIGLRKGSLNPALLTLNMCEQLKIPVAGGVLVERWEHPDERYREDVLSALQGKMKILGIMPFAPDEAVSVKGGAQIFEALF